MRNTMPQNLGAYACIGAFAVTFAAGTLFVISQRMPSANDVAKKLADEQKEDNPKVEEKPKGDNKAKKEDTSKPAPVVKNPVKLPGMRLPFNGTEREEAKAAVLRRWSIGGAAEKDEAHKPTYI